MNSIILSTFLHDNIKAKQHILIKQQQKQNGLASQQYRNYDRKPKRLSNYNLAVK